MIDTVAFGDQNGPRMLTQDELTAVMALPPGFRQSIWMRLLVENRVDVDYIRMAEGLDQADALRPDDDYTGFVIDSDPPYVDDEPFWPEPGTADITAGAAIYTGAWLTGALLVAAALVAVLVWRWLR